MKNRIFNSFKDLEQITSEMAGVKEFTSNASGKEEVDSLFEKYQKAQEEYDAIQKIIDDSKLEIEKINEDIILRPIPSGKGGYQTRLDRKASLEELISSGYQTRLDRKASLEKLISINERKLTKLKVEISLLKKQYEDAKSIYDVQIAERQRIQAEAFKAEQELKAAENARIYGEQTQKKLQEEEAAAKQKEKTKKLIIGGIAALLLIGGIVIGVKKGWFKKK